MSINQKGFGLIPVIVILLVIGAASAIGFRVLNSHKVVSSTAAVNPTSSKAPNAIKNPADLQKASDSMTGALDTSSLDADLNNLL